MSEDLNYDLIRIGFPIPQVDPPGAQPVRVCRACVLQRREPVSRVSVVDRRRINPYGDIWAQSGDGLLVSDRVRAILSICCPDQVHFSPVSDCTNQGELVLGFYVARPFHEFTPAADAASETIPCDGCQAPMPIHQDVPTARACWTGSDLVAGPLLPGPRRHYYASRRLVLLLQKAGVRGTQRYTDALTLEGEGPVHESSVEWADRHCTAIPTERTFRAVPPDQDWLDQILATIGKDHVGVHARALMAWQHSSGIPLPPSYRSLLFARDGFSFALTGRTRTNRVGVTGTVRLAGLGELGKPSLRLGQWDVPAQDDVERYWDGLTFATTAEGALWAFDLSRPTNRGEYPVFRYDPVQQQPVEFFDHFADWLHESWPNLTSDG